jgi:hypothetical protein
MLNHITLIFIYFNFFILEVEYFLYIKRIDLIRMYVNDLVSS